MKFKGLAGDERHLGYDERNGYCAALADLKTLLQEQLETDTHFNCRELISLVEQTDAAAEAAGKEVK